MMLDPVLDFFRGKAITIPPMDGAFRPNTGLDDADVLSRLPAPDNLVWNGRLIASSDASLYGLSDSGEPELLQSFAAPISALAVSPAGDLAVALDSGALHLAGSEIDLPAELRCITALAYAADGILWLANGSDRHTPSAWAADLMEKNARGSVWRRDASGFRRVADGLAFPYGLLPEASGVVVSESWRHRLVRISDTGKVTPVLRHLPGYPARLSPASGGGAWLSMFAPRNRLIEFVLQETHYRFDMMASVPPANWIAPALASGRSFLEPLQCGGIRTMGVHKAWAPSRSYGMVVRLDASMNPVTSRHSRANGMRHGTCSAIEAEGRLFVASKGGDCVLTLDAANAERI